MANVDDAGTLPHAETRDFAPKVGRSRRWLRFVGNAAQWACVAAALVHPIASLLSRRSWTADLISHFQVAALGVTLLACVATSFRLRRVAFILLALAACQVVPLLRYGGANPVPPGPSSPERLRLLLTNVLHDNIQYDDLARLIRAEKPDVVGIVEYTARWGDHLDEVRKAFPYRMELNGDSSGLALWFRKPPLTLDPPVWPVPTGNSYIHATFEFGGRTRHLWLAHPTSPMYRIGEPGNPEMDAIAEEVLRRGGSSIVMGDMNCTEGSAHLADFLDVSGLRDSRLGFGRQPSWPTDLPYRIAIDHVFVSDDLAVAARKLGPMIGSDHFPVIVVLAPAPAAGSIDDAQASHAATPSP